jgi:hypothetical protein
MWRRSEKMAHIEKPRRGDGGAPGTYAAGELSPEPSANTRNSATSGLSAYPLAPGHAGEVVVIAPLYERARHALAEAKAVDEALHVKNHADAWRTYARQARDRAMELDAAEIRIRAERRIGQLMQAQRESVGLATAGRMKNGFLENPISKPTLAEAGIDKNIADRARKYAAWKDDRFEERLADWRRDHEAEGERVATDILRPKVYRTQNTGQEEWYTPADILDKARAVLCTIDLDPASCLVAQRTVKAERFHTKEDDGLTKQWDGRVWLNPPYTQPAIEDFVDRLIEGYRAGRVSSAILLTHNLTDTAWFQKAFRAAKAICFTAGRIRFELFGEDQPGSPTQGQALHYFGEEVGRFAAVFADVGYVVPIEPERLALLVESAERRQ